MSSDGLLIAIAPALSPAEGDKPAAMISRLITLALSASRMLDKKPDLRLRSLGAHRLVEGRGVLVGYSAAVLLDADCALHADVPAEVPRTTTGRL